MAGLRKSLLVVTIAIFAGRAAHAEPRVLVLDPAASKINFTLDATGHEVQGTVAMKSGRISFDPGTGAASGEVTIDLTSARTGNRRRDKDMHEKVLETEKHPVAVFRAERLEGAVAPAGTSQVTLVGTLSFHGGEHKMKLPAAVELQNGRLRAESRFTIPYVEWGLQDPSNMFLKVGKVVSVEVLAVGSVQDQP